MRSLFIGGQYHGNCVCVFLSFSLKRAEATITDCGPVVTDNALYFHGAVSNPSAGIVQRRRATSSKLDLSKMGECLGAHEGECKGWIERDSGDGSSIHRLP